jgi:nucleoside-diphosphate-sugar epimerase
MQIFVTGATGYIGLAVVGELAAAGHSVTGLVRGEAKVEQLSRLGAHGVVGDIAEPATYREEAARHEVLVHTAFDYAAASPAGSDRTAIDTLLAAVRAGWTRAVVYTSGVWVLGATGDTPASEEAPTDHPAELVTWRVPHERLILDAGRATTSPATPATPAASAATPGAQPAPTAAIPDLALATAVIRPGIVYGGRGGIPGTYFESAEKEGAAKYVGDGSNRIPMIHVADLARFYRQVIEQRAAGIFHAVDGNAVPLAEVARCCSEAAGTGGATHSIPLDEARRSLGAFADALALDQVVESRRAGGLGWRPAHPSFVAEAGKAYQEWKGFRPAA